MKNTKLLLFYIIILSQIGFLAGCDEHGDPQGDIPLNDQQKATVSMRGVWAQASDVSLPTGTTEGVLDNLILEFRIDDNYNPSTFSASGADYLFSAADGLWNWEDATTTTKIELENVTPISQITVLKETGTIRVSFDYAGEQGGRYAGVGEYGVTLRKIEP